MCRRGLPRSSTLTHFEPELSERIIANFFWEGGLHRQTVGVATLVMDKPPRAQGELEDACEQPHEIQQEKKWDYAKIC